MARILSGRLSRRMPVVLGLLALAAATALLVRPRVEALPPAGTDVLPVGASVSVASVLGSETILFEGTGTIERDAPHLDGGVEVVDAEIIALDLTGTSLTGTVTVTESAIAVSPGELRSLQPPPHQFPASSFFDVYVVIQAPASPDPTITLRNNLPLRLVPMSGGVEVPLNEWPPTNVFYVADTSPCVPLVPTLPLNACITDLTAVLGSTSGGVGGIAELPDIDGAPSASRGDGGFGAGEVAGVAAGAAALSGAAWYGRRRLRRR